MATTSSFLLNHLPINGWRPRISNPGASPIFERFKFTTKIRSKRVLPSLTLCHMKLEASYGIEFPQLDTNPLEKISDIQTVTRDLEIGMGKNLVVLGDLGQATAKLGIGILGPSLSAFSFLFIARIVMSWYPNLPVGKFPYVLAYGPTEPILVATRKLIPPLGGVDVTPVVWFGLVSFLNEILVGPQGLLVLISQQVN